MGGVLSCDVKVNPHGDREALLGIWKVSFAWYKLLPAASEDQGCPSTPGFTLLPTSAQQHFGVPSTAQFLDPATYRSKGTCHNEHT